MRLSLSFVLLALIPVAPTFAATSYTVFTTADSGAQSLRAVIEAINANSTETVFNLNFNVGSNQTILVNSNLPRIGRANSFITIDGSLSPGLSIDGQGTSSLFYANQNALLVVRDLTLTRGESSEGGCLRAGTDGPPMTVQRVLFSGCIAGIGSGGAISASAQLNVTDSVFVDNRMNGMSGVGSGGGAILKTGTGNLIVEGSSFIDNAALGDGSTSSIALFGGAIYIGDGSLNHAIRGSWFSGNLAANPGGSIGGFGGAIHVEDGGLTVERSFFRGNQADREGGAIAAGSFVSATRLRLVQLRNSTFERNVAGIYGGAISVSNPGNSQRRTGRPQQPVPIQRCAGWLQSANEQQQRRHDDGVAQCFRRAGDGWQRCGIALPGQRAGLQPECGSATAAIGLRHQRHRRGELHAAGQRSQRCQPAFPSPTTWR
jgi:predicted outer membrane repeat protein